MAKGFNSRGMGGMGGGNMNSMIRQAQKMQQDMLKAQEELEAKTYEAGAGGGVVTATVSGKKELVSVAIDPEAVDPEDVEMLQDLIGRRQRGAAQGRRGRRRADVQADGRFEPALLGLA